MSKNSDAFVKILFWDTEVSPMLLTKFDLKPEWSSPARIVQDYFFLSAQWGWNGDDEVYTVSILDDPKRFKADHTDDSHVIKTMHKVLMEADVVVAHNGNGFDIPKFEERVICHGLPPLKHLVTVDTLKEARRFGFTSKSLAYLCKKLGLTDKLKNDPGSFDRAAMGDKKAIEGILEYGKGDIVSLKELYYKLRPYMKSHPNLNLFTPDGEPCCPHCGGKDFVKRGFVYNKTTVYPDYQCKAKGCGKRFKGAHSVRRSEYNG